MLFVRYYCDIAEDNSKPKRGYDCHANRQVKGPNVSASDTLAIENAVMVCVLDAHVA